MAEPDPIPVYPEKAPGDVFNSTDYNNIATGIETNFGSIGANNTDITALQELLLYEYDKRSALTMTETYQQIGLVDLAEVPIGVYEIKFSVAYNFADINDSAYFQFNVNNGAFYEFSSEPSDTTDRLDFIYFYPHEQNADGPLRVELQSRKEDIAASALSIQYADTIVQRVK